MGRPRRVEEGDGHEQAASGEEAVASSLDRRQLAVMLDRPIVLAGFMGVGKSSVGRLLAGRLGLPFYDTDELIEEQAGMTVQEVFARLGEPVFRTLERGTIADVVSRGRSVIALGGGAFVDPDTRRLLLEKALVVHLHLPWSEMKDVIDSFRPGRPLLAGKSSEEVHDLYGARLDAYRQAHLQVTVPRSSPEEGMRHVLGVLERLRDPTGEA